MARHRNNKRKERGEDHYEKECSDDNYSSSDEGDYVPKRVKKAMRKERKQRRKTEKKQQVQTLRQTFALPAELQACVLQFMEALNPGTLKLVSDVLARKEHSKNQELHYEVLRALFGSDHIHVFPADLPPHHGAKKLLAAALRFMANEEKGGLLFEIISGVVRIKEVLDNQKLKRRIQIIVKHMITKGYNVLLERFFFLTGTDTKKVFGWPDFRTVCISSMVDKMRAIPRMIVREQILSDMTFYGIRNRSDIEVLEYAIENDRGDLLEYAREIYPMWQFQSCLRHLISKSTFYVANRPVNPLITRVLDLMVRDDDAEILDAALNDFDTINVRSSIISEWEHAFVCSMTNLEFFKKVTTRTAIFDPVATYKHLTQYGHTDKYVESLKYLESKFSSLSGLVHPSVLVSKLGHHEQAVQLLEHTWNNTFSCMHSVSTSVLEEVLEIMSVSDRWWTLFRNSPILKPFVTTHKDRLLQLCSETVRITAKYGLYCASTDTAVNVLNDL